MSKFREAIVAIILSSLLGTLLVILSLWYHNPSGCEQVCSSEPCPPNTCMGGDSLTAGFPFPIVHDQTFSSPTSSWGRIDLDDYSSLNFRAFLLDVLFYGVIIIMLMVIGKIVFR